MTIENDGLWRRLSMVAALALLVGFGCGGGEGADRPEDCADYEFFDEGNERCLPCPAVVEPECPPECDVRIVDDGRDCPVMECEQDCGEDGADDDD